MLIFDPYKKIKDVTVRKKFKNFFSGISRPDPVPSQSRSGQDKFGTGRDTGRKPRLEPFSGRDTRRGCPDPVPFHEHP